jgi:hypothetical protein
MTMTAIASLSKNVEEKQSVANVSLMRVMNAIKTASKETGVDFAYLVNKAAQESGFRTDVKASTSSATGLYQFTEQTWLQMVHDNGSKHGVGALAAKIEPRGDGTLVVKDRALRQQILDLRKNPEMAASMAAELAQDNKAYLENNIGGTIGRTELYMAHFLGASGAADFLSAMRSNPQEKAAGLLPDAAAANRSVFYDGDGKAKSVGEIYNRFAAKMEGKGIDLPESIAAEPAMLAQVSTLLNQVPQLKQRMADITSLASASSVGSSSVSSSGASAGAANNNAMAGGATASALFSAMVLAQVDAFGAGANALEKDKKNEHEPQAQQSWVQTA